MSSQYKKPRGEDEARSVEEEYERLYEAIDGPTKSTGETIVKKPFPGVDVEAAKDVQGIIDALRSKPLTLREAMFKAKRKIKLYHKQSGSGWTALVMGRGRTVADKIACAVRFTPRSLLNTGTAAALAGLIEVAHFKGKALPGVTAAEAKKALALLAKGETGSPPSYALEFLAYIVGLIGEAWLPIRKSWYALGCDSEEFRKVFGKEVKRFTDKELRAWLSDPPLTGSAKLAERATGLSYKSFLRAWRKCPDIQRHFQLSKKTS